MLATLKTVFALLSSYALLLLGNGLFNTLLGIRAQLEGYTPELIGIVMSGQPMGLLLGALFASKIVSIAGHIRAFAAFASLISVASLLTVLWINPIGWLLCRVLIGFCVAGMIMVTESWLNERASSENRGQVMSFYMITNYFAAGCGQFLLPLGNPSDFQLFSLASIIFSLSLIPLLLTQAEAPKPARTTRVPFKKLYKVSPLGFIGASLSGCINASFQNMAPVFAQGMGLELKQISTFMACGILGGLLLQYPVGRLSDKIDRRWVLIIVAFSTSITAFAISLIKEPAALILYITVMIYGGLSFTIYSICNAHTNDFSDPRERVQTAASLLMAYAIGAISGPTISGAIMGQLGYWSLFAFFGCISGFLACFAFYRMSKRSERLKVKRSKAVNLPGGQFTSGQIYSSMRKQQDDVDE